MHAGLAEGGWGKYSLVEQLGNIGSEVNRALRFRGSPERFEAAIIRALELFDLTLGDFRWRSRLKEIARAREVFCDAAFEDGRLYKSSLEDVDRYLYQYAFAARINRQ